MMDNIIIFVKYKIEGRIIMVIIVIKFSVNCLFIKILIFYSCDIGLVRVLF